MDSVHLRSVKQLVSFSVSLSFYSRSAASRSVSVCDWSDASSRDPFHIKALAARLENPGFTFRLDNECSCDRLASLPM